MLERFTRLTSNLDGVVATTCDHDPIQAARSCGAAASRERSRGPDRLAASRGAKMTSYQTPYQKPVTAAPHTDAFILKW